jgi:flagellar assembly protein FliH
MSINDVRTESRTPAPAGRVSRILTMDEAQSIGMVPWRLEELEGTHPWESSAQSYNWAAPARTAKPAPAAESSEQDWSSKILELTEQHRRELQEAIERTRREAEARFQQQLQHEVEPWLRRLAASIEDLGSIRAQYLADSEEKVVRLSVAIAQRILHREIQIDSLALLGLLRAVVEKCEAREILRILMNPNDLKQLQPHLAKLQLPPRVEVAAENSLERGALLVESTSGTLDASVDAQLDEVERGFIDMLGKRGQAQ